MYNRLFQIIERIKIKSNHFEEGWGFLCLKGNNRDNLCADLIELDQAIAIISCSITIKIDGDIVQINELSDYSDFNSWEVNINKRENEKNGINYHFFYSQEQFLKWANNVDPFDPEYQVNKYNKLKIVVNSLKDSFGGEYFIVVNDSNEDFNECIFQLPEEKAITQAVHFVSDRMISIKPKNHLITSSKVNDKFAAPFLRNSATILVASFINEFYNKNKIVLRGVRRVQLNIIDDTTQVNLKLVSKIGEVVAWIYEDKVETRQKLFIDRISLDINYDLPLIAELSRIIDSAFQQAKERYNFVIIDRKENYLKEVRDLLKDIKAQSDLYSNKIRSLLGNLLRDALAGFLLVGFSLFTKLNEIKQLTHTDYFFDIVFKGLAIYFFVSAIIQAVIDITDMVISKKEMLYWKNVSREYIPQDEFNRHIQESLKKRICSVWFFYVLIIIFYFIIAIAAWNFPFIWKTYINN